MDDSVESGKSAPFAEIAFEAARITLEVDYSGNGPRLRVAAARLGRVIFLDPLELEALTWASPSTFQRRQSTSADRTIADLDELETSEPAFSAVIANEFARATAELDYSRDGPRLKIAAARLHRTIYLDPYELEVLTGVSPSTFQALLSTPFGPEAENAPSPNSNGGPAK
jgi:hypothetical protein